MFLIFILMFGIYGIATVSLDGHNYMYLCLEIKDDWRAYLVVKLACISQATIFILYEHITLIAGNQNRGIAAENQRRDASVVIVTSGVGVRKDVLQSRWSRDSYQSRSGRMKGVMGYCRLMESDLGQT